MSNENIIFIVGCAVLGYIIMSVILKKKESQKIHDKSDHSYRGQNEGDIKKQSEKDREWFNILEVSEKCSIEELNLAYRKKISEYHPDRVSTLGIELRVLAENKSKEINAAYQKALKLKQ